MIVLKCPGCKTRLEFAPELAGKKVRCTSCGDIFRVEAPAGAPRSGRHPAAAPKSGRHPAAPARPPADDLDDDRPPVRARRRDEDDDRPPVRFRRPLDEDDDRPPVKSRRTDDDEDRPPPRARHRDDDDEIAERDDRRRRDDDSTDDLPRRKLNPLWIAGPIVGVLVLAVVVVLIVRGMGKKKGSGDGEMAKGVSRTCNLDVPAKDVGHLVVPDGGNLFGLLRNDSPEAFRKKWVYEPYDLAAGRRVGKIDLPDVKEPVATALSPDGKLLLVTEKVGGMGWGGDHSLTLYAVTDGKCLTPQKWYPFPKDDRRPFDAPDLFRAEFVGPDRILTVGTNRTFHIFKVPSFEVEKSEAVRSTGEALGKSMDLGLRDREAFDWLVAFTADRSRWAVWNGDGYAVLDADGVELFRTPSVLQMARAMWPREAFLENNLRGGAVAFSPDGKTLAGFIGAGFGQQERMLCLWDATSSQLPETTRLTRGQHNEAAGLKWWGNRYLVLTGMRADNGNVDSAVHDTKTGLLMKQLMAPEYKKAAFGRDGRLWYAVSDVREDAAKLLVVDPPDAGMLEEGDGQYEEVRPLQGAFLKRLWMEPTGVLKKPTRYNPTLTSGLIRQP